MAVIIKEKDIQFSGFVPAPVNQSRRWYRELNYIVNNNGINKEIEITFETQNGTKKVKTNIIAVIEHYVKINEDVIIPLNSISSICLKESVITVKVDNSGLRIIFFIILFAILCIALVLYVFW